MGWSPKSRKRAEERFPRYRDRLAIEFDACAAASGGVPDRMPLSVRFAMRKHVGADAGFGMAELLLIMQALWLLWQVWQRYQASNPSFRAVTSRIADPVNVGDFLDRSAREEIDERD